MFTLNKFKDFVGLHAFQPLQFGLKPYIEFPKYAFLHWKFIFPERVIRSNLTKMYKWGFEEIKNYSIEQILQETEKIIFLIEEKFKGNPQRVKFLIKQLKEIKQAFHLKSERGEKPQTGLLKLIRADKGIGLFFNYIDWRNSIQKLKTESKLKTCFD